MADDNVPKHDAQPEPAAVTELHTPEAPSHATDVRETFARVRREFAQASAVNVVRMPLKEPR